MSSISVMSDKRMQLAITLEKKANDGAQDLGIEVLVTPYGEDGIRVVFLRGVRKGVRTLAVQTFGPIKTPIREFANGVFGAMWPKLKMEIEQVRHMQESFAK